MGCMWLSTAVLPSQGGAHAAANGGGGQAQLQRRVSRRDSFGLPDSLDLGTLDIDPGKPLGSSEGFAHAQPQQQQQHQQQQAHAPHAKVCGLIPAWLPRLRPCRQPLPGELYGHCGVASSWLGGG